MNLNQVYVGDLKPSIKNSNITGCGGSIAFNPRTQEAEVVQSHRGLCTEFQASQDYAEKSLL